MPAETFLSLTGAVICLFIFLAFLPDIIDLSVSIITGLLWRWWQ